MQSPEKRRSAASQKSHDFYEPLILLGVLNPSALARRASPSSLESTSASSQPAICRFLDRLSWMCDYETGGKTVCAIAAEETQGGTRFCFSANFKSLHKVDQHLSWILKQLEAAHGLPPQKLNEMEQEIAKKSIFMAEEKVKNYARHLCVHIRKVTENARPDDLQLLRDLSHLTDLVGQDLQLCGAADLFRDGEALRRLSRKVTETSSTSEWSLLRHHIGRLGSWHRASRTLVAFASAWPKVLRGFKTSPIAIPKAVCGPYADHLTNLQSVLERMFPWEQRGELLRAIETLSRLRGVDVVERFQQEYTLKTFKPRVHAEVCLLEHFYQNGLNFVEAIKYIGCSKPSCYCCDLYIKNHPGNFVRRLCHGNIWVNWQPPLLHADETQGHADAIMQAMITRMRQDVRTQVFLPSTQRPFVPDSTTGLTLSHLTVNDGVV